MPPIKRYFGRVGSGGIPSMRRLPFNRVKSLDSFTGSDSALAEAFIPAS
jgi:hypothetical protein